MSNVLFRRGDQTFIDENVPLNDGQIIFNETDEAIYVDNTINGTVVRKRYGGGNLSRSDVDSALSTSSTNPIQNQAVATALNGKAPTSHASTATTYGVGTTTNYGHCMTINDLNTSSHANGKALSAYQGKVLNDKIAKTEVLISNSGDAYDPTRPYKVGELCIYNNVLYRCITACSAGSWATNQSCFTQDTLTEVCNSMGANIQALSSSKVPMLQFYITASSASDFLTILRQNIWSYAEISSFVVSGSWTDHLMYVGYGRKTGNGINMEILMGDEVYYDNYIAGYYEHKYILSKTNLA